MDDSEIIKKMMLAKAMESGPAAAPSKAWTEYILEDNLALLPVAEVHPALRAAVYDKELAITNLKESEIEWLQWQFQRAEMRYKNSRPLFAWGKDDEILFSVLPAKLRVKLARSRDGGFERRQLTTTTEIKRLEAQQPQPVKRWRLFGREKV